MKNLVVKTLKILPLMLGSFGLLLPAAMSQTHFATDDSLTLTPEFLPKNTNSETILLTSEVDPATSEVLQQIQRARQPKGFQASNNNNVMSQVT